MQVNRVNSNPSFGATIKRTDALRRLVSGLLSGNGMKCYAVPEKDVVKAFDDVHKIFPLPSDQVVFTKYTSHISGAKEKPVTERLVKGYVSQEGVTAPFSFSFRDSEFNGGGYHWETKGKIPNLMSALLEARVFLKNEKKFFSAEEMAGGNIRKVLDLIAK